MPDSSINWKDTADAVKQLQADWKELGPAPRTEGEATWKRFREACDRFFERRKVHFDKEGRYLDPDDARRDPNDKRWMN